MKKYNVKNLIFSFLATVYGEQKAPYTETMKRGETINTYGTTKAMIEKILEDVSYSDNSWNITILRYFKLFGAHESGLLGESPNGIPNNLMPFVMKVAARKLDHLEIFGNDYPTEDGTGVRDFIHVVDFVKALEGIRKNKGLNVYNLGTGIGYRVLDIIREFEHVNNIKINKKITNRRSGDIAICYFDSTKAKNELGWTAKKTLEDMCKDSWNFEKNNQ